MDLNAIAASTTAQLEFLWDELGLDLKARQEHKAQLQQDIQYVCGKAIQDAKQVGSSVFSLAYPSAPGSTFPHYVS